MSVLRTVRKRKKVRTLGSVTIIRRAAYADLELDAKVELIRSLIPLGLMHVQELLDQEVTVDDQTAQPPQGLGDDQATSSGSRTPLLHLLPHLSRDRHHGVFGERGHD